MFSKEVKTPKEQHKFKYSNFSEKLTQEDEKKFHEDPKFPDSLLKSSSKLAQAESNAVTTLSLLYSKQKLAERKSCKSCLDSRAAIHPPNAAIDLRGSLGALKGISKKGVLTNQDKLADNIKSGSYHTRLQYNLKITHDYDMAA